MARELQLPKPPPPDAVDPILFATPTGGTIRAMARNGKEIELLPGISSEYRGTLMGRANRKSDA